MKEQNNLMSKLRWNELPKEVKRLSWGAFWFSWIWGVFNKTYITFLIIIPSFFVAILSFLFNFYEKNIVLFICAILFLICGIIFAFFLLFRGRSLAWRNKKWESVKKFNEIQNRWDIAGFIAALIPIFIFIISIIIFIISTSITLNKSNLNVNNKENILSNKDENTLNKSHLIQLDYYEFKNSMKIETMDGKIVQLKLDLGYKKNDKILQQELIDNENDIRDMIIKYISHLDSSFVINNKLDEDLPKQINRILNSGKIERILIQELTIQK